MPCNCLENSKEKILAKLTEMHPDYTISDADFENRIWCFEGPQEVILTHRFKYTYCFIKVNGMESKPKSSAISINPTYCGFCGKKFIEEDPA